VAQPPFLDLHGYGVVNLLHAFTTAGTWSITYSFDCRSDHSALRYLVSDAPTYWSTVVVNDSGASGEGTVVETSRGGHRLPINSTCAWTLVVTRP
jgi:hypothetical protein